MDDEDAFRLGFERMCEVIKPEHVVNYGTDFEWMKECAGLIAVPYGHPSKDREH
jgi:hypothetical protein